MRWDDFRQGTVVYQAVRMPRRGYEGQGFAVVGDYPMFTGGSIELSAESDLGASGSLDYRGESVPDVRDLVRVVYVAADEAGNVSANPIGTFVMSLGEPTYDMGKAYGSVELLSTLRIADCRKFGRPYTIKAGCNCVSKAVELIGALGLSVSAAVGTKLLRSDMVMDAGDSYLDAANALLDAAGFRHCEPDPYGGVVMRPVRTGEREAAWAFSEGSSSMLSPEVVLVEAALDAPNAVYVTYSGDPPCWAVAMNEDPLSPSSVANVGYEIGEHEQAADPGEGTAQQALADVMGQARDMLMERCSGTAQLRFSHPYVPIAPGDVVAVDYPSSGISFAGEVSSMALSWGDEQDVACETVAKRRMDAGFRPTVGGGML